MDRGFDCGKWVCARHFKVPVLNLFWFVLDRIDYELEVACKKMKTLHKQRFIDGESVTRERLELVVAIFKRVSDMLRAKRDAPRLKLQRLCFCDEFLSHLPPLFGS